MMATIRKRPTGYHVQIRLKGYPTQTATFERLTDARKWAASTESAIREGRHFKTAESKKHTLGNAINRYLAEVLPKKKPHAHQVQATQLKRWNDEIGHLLLADVTPSALAEVRDKLSNENTLRGKRSPSTVNRYLAAISHLFTIAVTEWGWMQEAPKVKKLAESRGRVRFLSDDERERLLIACRSHRTLYICVVLAISSGMRRGELMNLEWQDVDLKNGCIILHDTKNGERRSVPLVGKAKQLIVEHSKVRRFDSNLLFPGTNGPIDLNKAWHKAMKEAGIDNFRWHDLRHCTASYLIMNGVSPAAVAEILGHKTLQMVKRYSHLSESYTRQALESMNKEVFGDV